MEELENVQSKVFSKQTNIDGLDTIIMNLSITVVHVEKIEPKPQLKLLKNGTFAIIVIWI